MTAIETTAYRLKRMDDFFQATKAQRAEYNLWQLETELTHIFVNGMNLRVEKVSFLDWLDWRLQNELNEVTEEITEDAQFE